MQKVPNTPEVSNFFQPEDPTNTPTGKVLADREKYVKENLHQARLALINIQQLVGPLDPRWKKYDPIIANFESDITGDPYLKPSKEE